MKSWLEGKVISCLGDSITQGVGNNDISWTHYLTEMLPVKRINNYGIAGTRITRDAGWDQAFVDRYSLMDPESDIIIVWGGINDCNHALPLGDITSYSPETFYGALNLIADGLQKKYPLADILFITPMKANGFKGYRHWSTKSESGVNLLDYRQAILDVCQNHSIMVLDLFNESGITPDIPEIKECLLPDGLHPSKEGYLRIARKIANVLLYKM
ncbi:MAG: SGNH/GDSL hydrolase family protein [Erysipelotrichaceae bacterium]|nr:SGNH/GDSL hydrolase family protein [Erysipelotrichaceae bacterium]